MPDPAQFWNKRADKYAKQDIRNPQAYEQGLDHTRKHLSPTDHALEVGCGTGTTALLLAPSVKQITATDISQRMIEIGREKAAAEKIDNVCFEVATVFDRSLEKETFDVVLAFNFLHLLEDVPAGLRRLHELLKPGGRLISKTVCLAEQTRLWGWLLAVMKPLGLAPPVHCLKIAELEGAITGAGFEIVETGLYPPSPPSRFVVARKA